MYKHTFSMKAHKSAESVEFTLPMPDSLDDMDLIVERYGSVERMINRANAQHIVDVANNGGRKALAAGGKPAADAFILEFVNDGKKRTTVVRPALAKDQAKALGFTKEQLAALKAAGMKVE